MSSLPDSSPVVAILPEVVHLVALHQEVLSPEASLLVDQEATGADNPNLGTVYVVKKPPMVCGYLCDVLLSHFPFGACVGLLFSYNMEDYLAFTCLDKLTKN